MGGLQSLWEDNRLLGGFRRVSRGLPRSPRSEDSCHTGSGVRWVSCSASQDSDEDQDTASETHGALAKAKTGLYEESLGVHSCSHHLVPVLSAQALAGVTAMPAMPKDRSRKPRQPTEHVFRIDVNVPFEKHRTVDTGWVTGGGYTPHGTALGGGTGCPRASLPPREEGPREKVTTRAIRPNVWCPACREAAPHS